MAQLSTQIAASLAPFSPDLERLDAIPGVNTQTAEVILAEIGVDMRQFPTAKHLASWAGLCPGQRESAGKRKTGTTRKGNRLLRTALVEAALSASRATQSALAARYRRVMRHRGHKRPCSPSPTRCSSASITSSRARFLLRPRPPTTTIAATPSACAGAPSTPCSSAKAIV